MGGNLHKADLAFGSEMVPNRVCSRVWELPFPPASQKPKLLSFPERLMPINMQISGHEQDQSMPVSPPSLNDEVCSARGMR